MSVSAREAVKLIAKNIGNPSFKIIDVRTNSERQASFIPNSEHLPLNSIQNQLASLNRGNTYLVYCRTGRRSQEATRMMRSYGLEAINL